MFTTEFSFDTDLGELQVYAEGEVYEDWLEGWNDKPYKSKFVDKVSIEVYKDKERLHPDTVGKELFKMLIEYAEEKLLDSYDGNYGYED
jgi:hypothetical protein